MIYTEQDFQMELKKNIDKLYKKAKDNGLFPGKVEEELQKEKDREQRIVQTTDRYMATFKEIPEMWERISYFTDKGISIIINPNVKNNGYTADTITLSVSSEDPDQLDIDEVESMVTVIDKLKSADNFYSNMMESYNSHPLKGSDYLDLLMRYIIVKYINRPYHGYVEDTKVAEMLTAMMIHTLDSVTKKEEIESQIEADKVFNPNSSDGNCEFCTILKDDTPIDANFCLRMQDDSMIDLGIKPGDLLLFKEHIEIKNGDTVVVLVDGVYHMGKIYFEDDLTVLSPQNSAYESKIYHKDDNIKVCGKLVMLQHKFEYVESEAGTNV